MVSSLVRSLLDGADSCHSWPTETHLWRHKPNRLVDFWFSRFRRSLLANLDHPRPLFSARYADERIPTGNGRAWRAEEGMVRRSRRRIGAKRIRQTHEVRHGLDDGKWVRTDGQIVEHNATASAGGF